MKRKLRQFLIAAIKEATLPLFRAIYQQELQMSQQLDDLNAKVDSLTQTVADTATRVKTTQDALQAALDELKNHPAAEDLSGPIAKVQTAIDSLNQIDAPPAPAPAQAAPAAADQGAGATA